MSAALKTPSEKTRAWLFNQGVAVVLLIALGYGVRHVYCDATAWFGPRAEKLISAHVDFIEKTRSAQDRLNENQSKLTEMLDCVKTDQSACRKITERQTDILMEIGLRSQQNTKQIMDFVKYVQERMDQCPVVGREWQRKQSAITSPTDPAQQPN